MIAYKLFKVRKDGSIGSLFINQKDRLQINTWLEAKPHRTKGFAFRPGWHALFSPSAPHLSKKGRRWHRVYVEDCVEFERPASQGGKWVLAQRMKILEPVTP